MINPEKEIFDVYQTRFMRDDSVAKLLDWMQGDMHRKDITVNEDGILPYRLPVLHSLEVLVQEHLMEQREAARQDFIKALESVAPFKVLKEKADAVGKRNEVVKKVASYLRKINAAIPKGQSTVLTTENYLALKSDDQWARMQQKDDSIMTLESSTKNGLEPQGLPPAGIEPDMDKKEKQEKQPKWRQQEKAILAAITSLGHDPKSLPKNEDGKPGVKAAVKKSLTGNDLFAAKTAFKKTWDGLLSDSKISYVK